MWILPGTDVHKTHTHLERIGAEHTLCRQEFLDTLFPRIHMDTNKELPLAAFATATALFSEIMSDQYRYFVIPPQLMSIQVPHRRAVKRPAHMLFVFLATVMFNALAIVMPMKSGRIAIV